MYLDNEDFTCWTEKISSKLTEIAREIKLLVQTKDVLEENEKILDNQDLCFLLKVSNRTLQRYRDDGSLPFFRVKAKIYYRASEIRDFIRSKGTIQKINLFEKATRNPA
ncbi:hypothetical protein GGR21_000640 [Dysgonomonas hofstadii]|jgi:hypothetical protein|uniref:Helix-turn-helix domain-containing protein n=1 Tax=Dysgonomonas hofstadii TaxID=637886 RepID=A0A840CSP4_9BACT|nr:helix-turn-helix domain-containing protein [Dysgonomonas hofstadii]MBB4034753.1 hypothetical protein [Dysgonomonas hofstadii]